MLGLALKQSLEMSQILEQILGRELQEMLERRYPELFLVFQRIAQQLGDDNSLFTSKRFSVSLEDLESLGEFISCRIERFCHFLNTDSKYKFNLVSTEEGKPKVETVLRLATFIAFVGHFGVKRRERGLDGQAMDYFLHPLFAAFFELPYVVGLRAWQPENLEGVDEELIQIAEVVAVLLHDLFEDIKKGQLVLDGMMPNKLEDAFVNLIREDIPQLLGLSEPLSRSFGDMILSLIQGVSKTGNGRLVWTLHQLRAFQGHLGPGLLGVKLADRSQNGNTFGAYGENPRSNAILAETKLFAALARQMGNRTAAHKLSFVAAQPPKNAEKLYKVWLEGRFQDYSYAVARGLAGTLAPPPYDVFSVPLVTAQAYDFGVNQSSADYIFAGVRVGDGGKMSYDWRFKPREGVQASFGTPFQSGSIPYSPPSLEGVEQVERADAKDREEGLELLFGSRKRLGSSMNFSDSALLERARSIDEAMKEGGSDTTLTAQVQEFYFRLEEALLA